MIVALDPGKATGVAWLPPGGGATADEWAFDEVGGSLHLLLEDLRPRLVVCERYTIGPETLRKSRGNWSLELIGVARYLAGAHGAAFELQAPGDAKGLVPDEALKHIMWWHPSDHARDALRHLALAMVRGGDHDLAARLASR